MRAVAGVSLSARRALGVYQVSSLVLASRDQPQMQVKAMGDRVISSFQPRPHLNIVHNQTAHDGQSYPNNHISMLTNRM